MGPWSRTCWLHEQLMMLWSKFIQGCCLKGTQWPEAPTITFPCGWLNFLKKEPAGATKTYDSYGNSLYAYFQWRNNRIPCSFCTFEMKMSTLCLSNVGKTFLLLKLNKQAVFWKFTTRTNWVSYLSSSITGLLEKWLGLLTLYFYRCLKGSQKIFLGSSLVILGFNLFSLFWVW